MDIAVAVSSKRSKNNLWTPIPGRKHGVDVVTIIVGTNADLPSSHGQHIFAVHRNLLLASSTYFHDTLHGNPSAPATDTIYLLEESPRVFQIYYGFLYTGIANEQDTDGSYENDHFWLLVYMLADRIMAHGLKPIAFHRFKACFPPTESKILPGKRRKLPSNELVAALFDTNDSPEVFRAWMVDHILWHHFCSKSIEGLDVLLDKFPALAAEIGRAVVKVPRQFDKDYIHPSYDPAFCKKYGLDYREVRSKARTAAEILDRETTISTQRRKQTRDDKIQQKDERP